MNSSKQGLYPNLGQEIIETQEEEYTTCMLKESNQASTMEDQTMSALANHSSELTLFNQTFSREEESSELTLFNQTFNREDESSELTLINRAFNKGDQGSMDEEHLLTITNKEETGEVKREKRRKKLTQSDRNFLEKVDREIEEMATQMKNAANLEGEFETAALDKEMFKVSKTTAEGNVAKINNDINGEKANASLMFALKEIEILKANYQKLSTQLEEMVIRRHGEHELNSQNRRTNQHQIIAQHTQEGNPDKTKEWERHGNYPQEQDQADTQIIDDASKEPMLQYHWESYNRTWKGDQEFGYKTRNSQYQVQQECKGLGQKQQTNRGSSGQAKIRMEEAHIFYKIQGLDMDCTELQEILEENLEMARTLKHPTESSDRRLRELTEDWRELKIRKENIVGEIIKLGHLASKRMDSSIQALERRMEQANIKLKDLRLKCTTDMRTDKSQESSKWISIDKLHLAIEKLQALRERYQNHYCSPKREKCIRFQKGKQMSCKTKK